MHTLIIILGLIAILLWIVGGFGIVVGAIKTIGDLIDKLLGEGDTHTHTQKR